MEAKETLYYSFCEESATSNQVVQLTYNTVCTKLWCGHVCVIVRSYMYYRKAVVIDKLLLLFNSSVVVDTGIDLLHASISCQRYSYR